MFIVFVLSSPLLNGPIIILNGPIIILNGPIIILNGPKYSLL
jgi:hypothetical protein